MNIFTALTLTLATGLAAAEDACERPWPLNLPEVVVEREAMLSLQREVKAYIASAEAYLACNERKQAALPEGDYEATQQRQILVNLYNNTVDEMHHVGARYNTLVRAFKGEAGSGADAQASDGAGGG